MVYLIENYQISWQEMPGCRNFPFSLNRTPFKGLGESFSPQRWQILACYNPKLPSPGDNEADVGLTDSGSLVQILRMSEKVGLWIGGWGAGFHTLCSKTVGSVGYGLISTFRHLKFLRRPNFPLPRAPDWRPMLASCRQKWAYQRASPL